MKILDPTKIHIRPAGVADAPRLAAMRYQFRSEIASATEPEELFVARATTWMASRLAQAAWRAWVAATADDELVGQIFAQFVEKIPNPVVEAEQLVYLTNVYVVPSWRNRGIGSRLLRIALEACRAADVETIILWPSRKSRPLYQRFGFVAPHTLLERSASGATPQEHGDAPPKALPRA
ncbi:MAG TPA: GNAT family N-acetyltransferase [Herpetosiphonaceae bacterium]